MGMLLSCRIAVQKSSNKSVNIYSNATDVYYVKKEYFHASLNKFLGLSKISVSGHTEVKSGILKHFCRCVPENLNVYLL